MSCKTHRPPVVGSTHQPRPCDCLHHITAKASNMPTTQLSLMLSTLRSIFMKHSRTLTADTLQRLEQGESERCRGRLGSEPGGQNSGSIRESVTGWRGRHWTSRSRCPLIASSTVIVSFGLLH